MAKEERGLGGQKKDGTLPAPTQSISGVIALLSLAALTYKKEAFVIGNMDSEGFNRVSPFSAVLRRAGFILVYVGCPYTKRKTDCQPWV